MAVVLVVDDDEFTCDAIRRLLGRMGYSTACALSGGDALDLLEKVRPDVIVLDWMMPKMDGPALFRQMKLRPETSALPVVFITAKASQHDLDELLRLGAAGAISKPFSPKDLPDQLRAIWAKLP